MKLVKPFLHAGMSIEDLFLVSLVKTSSIYPRVGVVISIKEVTMNHVYRELSITTRSNILCNPVLFGPNVELSGNPLSLVFLLGL